MHKSRSCTILLLILLGCLSACEKEDPEEPSLPVQGATNPYGAGNGAGTFYLNSTAPYSMNSLTLNGVALGDFDQYFTSGAPSCGTNTDGLVITVIRPAGSYTWCATRGDGVTYSGSINIALGSCVLYGIGYVNLGNCGGPVVEDCVWDIDPSYVNVGAIMSDMCGEPNGGITLTMTNQSSQALKIGVCIRLNSGNWYSTSDGTFDAGVAPGASVTVWNCYATGEWRIYVIPRSTFIANSCSYPGCS